ncbi:MAG: hypothetical protein HXX19_12830, partial [Rhodoferax sp.]|nr:hypothetical protein [Rhodoferax sp.]
MTSLTEQQLATALATQGLSLRGAFAPTPADGLPLLPQGQVAASVWMVGVIGSGFWPHFKVSPCYSDGLPHALDRWSRTIGEDLAQQFGGLALFPFEGPPYWPFQRWADRAEATEPSRMLLRIHPQHGLWHAYRFALALPQPAPAPGTAVQAPPAGLCARCSGQPCLGACPVGAYTGEAFLLDACAAHLHSGRGQDCMQGGCLARRACPVAPDL